MSNHKLVVRFSDGRVLKGATANFNPRDSTFMLRRADVPPGSEVVVVDLRQVKALFFVRDFAGNSSRRDRASFREHQPYSGRKAEVVFNDGEAMLGSVPSRTRDMLGFYLFPADEDSNALKVFVVNASVRTVRWLEGDAEPSEAGSGNDRARGH